MHLVFAVGPCWLAKSHQKERSCWSAGTARALPAPAANLHPAAAAAHHTIKIQQRQIAASRARLKVRCLQPQQVSNVAKQLLEAPKQSCFFRAQACSRSGSTHWHPAAASRAAAAAAAHQKEQHHTTASRARLKVRACSFTRRKKHPCNRAASRLKLGPAPAAHLRPAAAAWAAA